MFTKMWRKHPDPEPHMTDRPQTIARFSENRWLIVSQKPEGRPVCLTYTAGSLSGIKALEPGGLEGADVTGVLQAVDNIPVNIGYDEDLEVYGTVVLPWEQYKVLCGGEEYSDEFPDELAKSMVDGAVRLESVRAELIVWHCGMISGLITKQEKLRLLTSWGFKAVNHKLLLPTASVNQIECIQRVMNPFACDYQTGSLLFEDNGQDGDLQCLALKWPYDISEAYRLCAHGRGLW